MILILSLGISTALLSFFINYCLGKPGSDHFNTGEIFSWYTIWLSKKRLKKLDLLDTYLIQLKENIMSKTSISSIIQVKHDFNKMMYEAAEPFFTWEKAVGMCIVCTGFWMSLFTSLIFTKNITDIAAIILLSHSIIRVLTKLKL